MKLLLLIASTLVGAVSAVNRISFNSNGTQIVGYHWSPALKIGLSRIFGRPQNTPIVVMAHGLAALQSSKLQPYAERFAQEGYHAITFDYRHWGQSDGLPRNIVDLELQQQDYKAAVKFVKKLKGVDPSRIIIWGSSLSGGTVLQLGASFYNDTNSGVKGVISQVPHTNGPATSALPPQGPLQELVQLSVQDTYNAKQNKTPIYVPVTNHTGEFGLLTQPGAYEGYQSIQPHPPGSEYSNIAARFIVTLPLFSPDAVAAQSHLPTYIGIGLADNVVSPIAAVKLADRMPCATV